ncbi:MAG TPA: hypothetical protein VK737_06905, partial [Opitutales bacterium]|nr:hypothetical protein [Opitutales bacterium]
VRAEIPASDKAAKLQAKLKQEQALASWVYLVNSWILDPATRDRAQLLQGRKDSVPAGVANAGASDENKPKPSWTPRVIQ